MRLEVNDKRVKITRIDGGKEKYEIRSYDDYDAAVDFCLQEEAWLLSEGFKANNSKFVYSFIDDDSDGGGKGKNPSKSTKKK